MRAAVKSVGLGVSLVLSAAASAHGGSDGVVTGGGYYRSAVVCVAFNDTARCDRDEPRDFTDASGRFSFRWNGPVVAEIIPGVTRFHAPRSGTTTPVHEALTFRAPAG